MIGYLDTSASVPLLVAEPSSPACRRFWDDADGAVHCAAAEQLAASDLVAASGDVRLLAAWSTLGVATYDPNR